MNYTIQEKPTVIPVPGNKLIEEHVGIASTGHTHVSVAHMIAPPRWTEPTQTPLFDEVTIIVRGRMRITIDESNAVEIGAGQSIYINKGVRVQYANPFDDECEYWAICTPAFSVSEAGRDEN
jgi:mannose-6-phosphate isomerase-like protein (cupin superfamily)